MKMPNNTIDNQAYLQLHPEIKSYIQLFITEAIHTHPSNLRKFAFQIFNNESAQNFISHQFGYECPDAQIQAQMNQLLKEQEKQQQVTDLAKEQMQTSLIVKELRNELMLQKPELANQISQLQQQSNQIAVPYQEQLTDLKQFIRHNKSSVIEQISRHVSSNNLIRDIQEAPSSDAPQADLAGIQTNQAPTLLLSANQQQLTIKLQQLSEFALKSIDFSKFKDLGNVILLFPPIKDQISSNPAIASRFIAKQYFKNSLTVQMANSINYEQYCKLEILKCFQASVVGVGYKEYLFGLQNMRDIFPNSQLVISNVIQPISDQIDQMPTVMSYFPAMGRNFKFITSHRNYLAPNTYKYLPLIFKANYINQQVSDFCVVFLSFVPIVYCGQQQSLVNYQGISDTSIDEKAVKFDEFSNDKLRLTALSARLQDSIINDIRADLNDLQIQLGGKEFQFCYLSDQHLMNADSVQYTIMNQFIADNTIHNLNLEFGFDTIINQMDQRTAKYYNELKFNQLNMSEKYKFEQDVNSVIQYTKICSFKNMEIAQTNRQLITRSVTQSMYTTLQYADPLATFITQSFGAQDSDILAQYPLKLFQPLANHYVYRNLLYISQNAPVLQYLCNITSKLIIQHYSSIFNLLSQDTNPPQLISMLSSHIFVKDGILEDFSDFQHTLHCEKGNCQLCDNMYKSTVFLPEVTNLNIFRLFPHLYDEKNLFYCRLKFYQLKSILALAYEQNHQQPLSINCSAGFQLSGIGFAAFHKESVANAVTTQGATDATNYYLFDVNLYRTLLFKQFQYQNVDGVFLSDLALHQRVFAANDEELVRQCSYNDSLFKDTEITVICDKFCFLAYGVGTLMQREGLEFVQFGDCKDCVLDELKESLHAADMALPTSVVSDYSGRNHIELQCKGVGLQQQLMKE